MGASVRGDLAPATSVYGPVTTSADWSTPTVQLNITLVPFRVAERLNGASVKLRWLLTPAMKMEAASSGVSAFFQTPRSSIQPDPASLYTPVGSWPMVNQFVVSMLPAAVAVVPACLFNLTGTPSR